VRVGVAQVNPTVGDLAGNVERCLDAVERAAAGGAELVVLPEMVIPGYPPRDILYDPGFVTAVGEATRDLAARAVGLPPLVVGTVVPSGRATPGHPGLLNAAAVLERGEVRAVVGKRLLPSGDVFFENRWFVPGSPSRPITLAGCRVGLMVSEDLWDEGHPEHPAADLEAAGAALLVVISASPFRRGILERRLHHARRAALPLVYANLCGATDELIFDGRSFVLGADGAVLTRLAGFEEEVAAVDLDAGPQPTPEAPGPDEELYRALVLGVRDFAAKNRLERAVLGLSGGVDSAVAAVLAADALGPGRVTAVTIPSRFTDPRSTACAGELAGQLGVALEEVALEPLHAAAEACLGELPGHGTGAENVQARLRMLVLMAVVNRRGGFLLNTTNKTEASLGYGTLYGDLAGSLCPLADLTKPEVVRLARWLHATRRLIPRFVLERPPSAELAPGQVDPFDYGVVAPAMEELVRADRSDSSLRRSEHKRRQMGVVLKVSERAFGTGRLIPITRR